MGSYITAIMLSAQLNKEVRKMIPNMILSSSDDYDNCTIYVGLGIGPSLGSYKWQNQVDGNDTQKLMKQNANIVHRTSS